jgi:formamidopyrimidine-DNA glycosylase
VPELPFLEILAENLAPVVSGRRIDEIQILQPALLQRANPPPESFAGEYLSLPMRIGKYLVLETESRRVIVLHLMRAGRLVAQPAPEDGPAKAAVAGSGRGPLRLPKHVSARLVFDDSSELRLVEHGTEKRARLWLAEDRDEVPELRAIGPDPSRGELTAERFRAAIRADSRQLKSWLTDQRAISGIGNGLSDEILYEARLSPLQLTSNLDGGEEERVRAAIGAVVERQVGLLRASAAGALPQKEPVEHYVVHDHRGDPCPRCGATIAWVRYADHDLFYCPGCQTGGKPLKDRRLSKLLK